MQEILTFIGNLQLLDGERFFQLKTDIEIIESSADNFISLLEAAQELKLSNQIKIWASNVSSKFVSLVKIEDTSNSVQIFLEMCNNQTFFDESLDHLLGQNICCIGVTSQYAIILYSQESQILTLKNDYQKESAPSTWAFLFPRMDLIRKSCPNQSVRMINCLMPHNKYSFKWIKNTQLKEIINISQREQGIYEILSILLNPLILIPSTDTDRLELLLNFLQSLGSYDETDQEFVSPWEYFQAPELTEWVHHIKLLTKAEHQSVLQQTDKITLVINYSKQYRDSKTFLCVNNKIQPYNISNQLNETISSYSKQKFICFVMVNSLMIEDLNPIVDFIHKSKDQLIKPQFELTQKWDPQLFEKASTSFLNIQTQLNPRIASLDKDQLQTVHTQLTKLLINSLMIQNK